MATTNILPLLPLTRPVADVVYREDLYPRIKTSAETDRRERAHAARLRNRAPCHEAIIEMPRRTTGASPEAFVRAWQTSATVAEAAKKLGMTPLATYERARRYRMRGIPLTDLGLKRDMDVAALKALAASLRRIR